VGTCTTTAFNDTLSPYVGQVNAAIPRGGYVSYLLPVYTDPGKTIQLASVQSPASQNYLGTEFAISACPGDFTNVTPECQTWGYADTGGTMLYVTTGATPVHNQCTLLLGQRFYINVRNVASDMVTPACSVGTCYMSVLLHSN
jgi:hypothetical protein